MSVKNSRLLVENPFLFDSPPLQHLNGLYLQFRRHFQCIDTLIAQTRAKNQIAYSRKAKTGAQRIGEKAKSAISANSATTKAYSATTAKAIDDERPRERRNAEIKCIRR